jgi:hypothetical protein
MYEKNPDVVLKRQNTTPSARRSQPKVERQEGDGLCTMLRQRHTTKGENDNISTFSTERMLKKVDIYPKLHREFKVQTEAGGTGKVVGRVVIIIRRSRLCESCLFVAKTKICFLVVSVITMVVMAILFLSELKDFLTPQRHEHMRVDTSSNERLQITFDISLWALNCRGTNG